MAAGEYVSVSAQADVEAADLERERRRSGRRPRLRAGKSWPKGWRAAVSMPALAVEVAAQMTDHDALGPMRAKSLACSAWQDRQTRYRPQVLRPLPLPLVGPSLCSPRSVRPRGRGYGQLP